MSAVKQSMIPCRSIFHAGDTVTFRLDGIGNAEGTPVLRSNLENASVNNCEIIAFTEEKRPPAGNGWRDLKMKRCGDSAQITVPLTQIGVFEAKCCFICPEKNQLLWPEGGNLRIKVESAESVCANSIYSAFVRQFGASRSAGKSAIPEESLKKLDRQGYTVIPPSGTFRDLKRELDHIFGELGCRILQLLPVHPSPTSYGRMGRYGSPFASLDYFSVDPALAEFDVKATPLEQFEELIDAVHCRDGRIFMDIPVNHTGWASVLQNAHPEYFVRKADGEFESPGAWGITWADLCKLDYHSEAVHHLMAEVFLHWCAHGVDGFRCDAGYMLPQSAWDYIVAKVRMEYPDTVFLLEGLGGKLSVQESLLGSSGLDWAYSELFQNYNRDDVTRCFAYAGNCSAKYGTLVNFAETHDNLRLAAKSHEFSRIRFAVAAFLCCGGAFGFANGAEFYASERIDVHGCGALNWGDPENLNSFIACLNAVMAQHSAFESTAEVKLVQVGPGNVIAVKRTGADGKTLLGLINLEEFQTQPVQWERTHFSGSGFDLLAGKEFSPYAVGSGRMELMLEGAQTLLLAAEPETFALPDGLPERVLRQRADAMALSVCSFFNRPDEIVLPEHPGEELRNDVSAFLEKYSHSPVPPVTNWEESRDAGRIVMVPPGDMLAVWCGGKFRVSLIDGGKNAVSAWSIPESSGRSVALLRLPECAGEHEITLKITVFEKDSPVRKRTGKLLLLQSGRTRRIGSSLSACEVFEKESYAFGSNLRGGYAMFPACWGVTGSKYDAILAANFSDDCPVDRRTMFTHLRGWIECKGYSQELSLEFLQKFTSSVKNCAVWNFLIPAGHGLHLELEVHFSFSAEEDAVRFTFLRRSAKGSGMLPDNEPVRLILRPDVEDRINHQLTKAYAGPEQKFPQATVPHGDGFDFSPDGHLLSLRLSKGEYHPEIEWHYMTDLPRERYYGMEDKTDLFSPGYFVSVLSGGEGTMLYAAAGGAAENMRILKYPDFAILPEKLPVEDILYDAMQHFLVRRDDCRTIIAGYPWFLDWGRDTLIALRGMISSGRFREDAEKVLIQFAMFEENGTIPNMIRGCDNSNRDTSDAPLYLIVAVRDFLKKYPKSGILTKKCGCRTMLEVLFSIVHNVEKGTPNGIRMDAESGLIYSPSHFSWMDTNFPAGTPRSGYPIEIQALWYAALNFLGEFDGELRSLAQRVQNSVEYHFFRHASGRVSDCLHCSHGFAPARQAVPDDHTRSNMLTAVILGAVKDEKKCKQILAESEELLVPGGIRSLSDRDVQYHLPISHHGCALNDSHHPYRGSYSGPEDTSRKVAYHNGTVWCWPFPAYCEALYLLGGKAARRRAFALLMSSARYLESGVFGQLPEVADGDAPHRFGGCAAQAWSITEFARVYELLH